MKKNIFSFMIAFTLMLSCLCVITACDDDANNNLVIAPTQSYVINCLEKIPGVMEVEAVTEANDPNNLLNKIGGYYASIYFSYQLIDQADLLGYTLIDKGVDAGGCIEVYKTTNEASKRNEYLAAFDGTFLTSGSHKVVGTLVVRTSNKLLSSQQKFLESNIIAALLGQDDKIVPLNTNTNEDNNNDAPNQSSGNAKEDAINDAEEYAIEFAIEYPDDYLTPNYIMEYLRDVLGYSETIAVYATENCDISWTTHAKKLTQVYLTYEEEFGRPASWWTSSDIEYILVESGFSYDTIEKTMSTIDWETQLKKYVKHLSDFYDTFTRSDARYYLEDIDIVANEYEVEFLLENSGVNWKQHALNMANHLWIEYNLQGYYEDILTDIREELSFTWEYTEDEIDYAIQNITKC